MSSAAAAPSGSPAGGPSGAPAVPPVPATAPGILRNTIKSLVNGVTGFFTKPAAAHGHGAHGAGHGGHEEGWSTGKKVAVGAAAVGVVGAVAAGGAAIYAGKKVLEFTPKAANAVGRGAAATVRAPIIVSAHTLGTPFELADRGYNHASDIVIGAPHYEDVKGWMAPWKAFKNSVKAVFVEPTRVVTGLAYGATGVVYGPVKGFAEGVNRALGGDPNWQMPGFRWMKRPDGHELHNVHVVKETHDAHGHGTHDAHGIHDDHDEKHDGHDDVHGDDEHALDTHAHEEKHDDHAAHHRKGLKKAA